MTEWRERDAGLSDAAVDSQTRTNNASTQGEKMMHTITALRYLGAIAAVSPLFFGAATLPAAAQSGSKPKGYIVTSIEYALSKDAKDTGACPDGMTAGYSNMGDVFLNRPDMQHNPGETEDAYIRRAFISAFKDPTIKNLCLNPELGKPNPTFKTVTGKNVPAYGIDLDGQDSRASGTPAPGTCAHDDFRGMNGERGIDNQFFRVVGCSKSFQSTGQSNTYTIAMYTGEWGILLALKGVTNLQNDDNVEVDVYANADPIQLSPTREPLANATYAAEQDPRFRTVAHGRIVNGVLTTDPVDMRFHWIVNNIHLERTLDDARLRATFTPDGAIDAILAGYTPVDDMYNFQYSFGNGKDANGKPAPYGLRAGSAIGQARVLDHTCEGAYYALQAAADGHRDPATGKCTAISTQYHIKAIPAFVVDVATKSINSDLDKGK
jgi:hypothetical protein